MTGTSASAPLRLRILLCAGEFPPDPHCGGIGTATRAAAAALAAHHEVHVLHCQTGLEPADVDDPSGFVLHRRPVPSLSNRVFGSTGITQAVTFRRYADRLGRFDIVEVPDWEAVAAGFVVRRRQLVIADLFTPTEVIRAHGGRGGNRLRSRLERWACRRADAAISSGPPLTEALVALGWFDRPGDAPVHPPCLDSESAAHDAPPLPGQPRLLGVGRLEPRKGFDLLIRAAALLPVVPEIVLVGRDVPGADGQTGGRALTTLAERLGVSLRLVEPVPHGGLEPWFTSAWALVVPSTFDSFNMAALEASARGRAVVGTDRVGFIQLAADGDGIRSVERTPAGLASGLASLVSDRSSAATAGRAAQARARALFGPAQFAADRQELYRSLLGS